MKQPCIKQIKNAMSLCIDLARDGLDAGEVPVGAVLLDHNGSIVASSTNKVRQSGQAIDHAECIVLRDAAQILGYRDLRDLTLVCNLEPCQMCTEACKLYRVGHVIFGAYNLSKEFRSPSSWIGGICEQKAYNLLRSTFNRIAK